MSIVLISDLHLQESRPNMAKGFLDFLENLEAKELYILGDFFEYWIGDDDNSAFNIQIMQALRTKTSQGLPIYFMHGNRDFLIGAQFADFTGVKIIPENYILKVADKTYVLAHGDALCTLDKSYLLYRKLIRNKLFIKVMMQTSLNLRRKIATYLRKKSKSSKSNKSLTMMDVSTAEVVRLLETTGADGLIHGHTHRPKLHQVKFKSGLAFRLVLGDWNDNLGYQARIDATGEVVQTTFNF